MDITHLNLGCGDHYIPGYTNVDLRTDCRTDLLADVTDLHMIASGTVTEIVAHDILEHFPESRTDEILAEWARLLAPGGTLQLKVPNMVALAQQLLDANRDDHGVRATLLIRNIYGGHRWGPEGAWDTHHHGFSPRLLELKLNEHGFKVLSNDHKLNMTVVAVKG